MENEELAYWRARGLRFNPGAPPPEPTAVRVTPYPAPLVLSEPQHDGERLVYESFLRSSPDLPGFAAYSMPLPSTGNRRIEADFVALMPNGVALIEVKGGLVQVDSRPGPGVRWAHWTRSGKPTGGSVNPTQLFRVTETFSVMAQAMASVEFGPRIAQLMVFPHTSRTQINPAVLARLDAPDRDFMRIVFAEDLAAHGMWRLVEDELLWPGRSHALTGNDVTRLIGWIKSELDVRPGASPLERDVYEAVHPRQKPLSFSNYPPPADEPLQFDRSPVPAQPARMTVGDPQRTAATPRSGRWLGKIGIVLAILLAGALWVGRSSETTLPAPAAVATAVASAPARSTPTPDPFQAALTKAIGEPEKRIAAGEKDWVRALGPVTGRPGCQFAEMSYSGKSYNVIACRDGDRGAWRY